jgi:hypothetical protein
VNEEVLPSDLAAERAERPRNYMMVGFGHLRSLA